MDEELKNFDPRRYWAAANGELISDAPRITDSKFLEEIVHFCWKPRSIEEILTEIKIPRGRFSKILNYIRHTRGVMTETRLIDGVITYRMKDSRTA